MVELQHSISVPAALVEFLAETPTATVPDFDGLPFKTVKIAIKTALHQDQGGLCAYCEKPLTPTAGQIDHIKPKGGPNAYPHLCFTYANYAHSCINPKTCGQKKKSGLLPREPGPHCNDEWTLSTDGSIELRVGMTKARSHMLRQTRDMLGLNADSNLVDERKKWLAQTITILQQAPDDIQAFLQAAPFRHMLATVI